MLKSLFGKHDLETVTTKKVELIPTADVDRLRVDIHNGQVTLRQWEQNLIQAVVTVKVNGSEPEADTDRFWKFEQFGSSVTFEQQMQLNTLFDLKRVRIDVELHLPRNVQARWETHNGSVRLADIEGALQLTAHNGHVEAEHLSGDVSIESHNGDVSLQALGGDVKITTHNGKILLDGFSSALRLITHNGEIRARTTEPLATDWKLSSHNGDITLLIPEGTGAQLRMSAHRGKITGKALPVQVSGQAQELLMTIGQGGRDIAIDTHSGHITVDFS